MRLFHDCDIARVIPCLAKTLQPDFHRSRAGGEIKRDLAISIALIVGASGHFDNALTLKAKYVAASQAMSAFRQICQDDGPDRAKLRR